MSLCIARASHFYRAKFIPQLCVNRRSIRFTEPTMTPDLWEKKESNMINKLLGAAAMVAVIYSTVPASAANMAGCSSANLEKTEATVETMADGQGKIVAQKEMAQAQDALLSGKMGACAMHLSKAMHAGAMAQGGPAEASK
jgi:predicted phage tail protein